MFFGAIEMPARGQVEQAKLTASDRAVYVLRLDGTRWVERQKLPASDPVLGGQLGKSVAVDGDVAAIGRLGDSFLGPVAEPPHS